MPSDLSEFCIESFDPARHSRDNFDCGVESLNNFLKYTAKKRQQDDMIKVFVAVTHGKTEILGYYSTNACSVAGEELGIPPKHTPSHGEIPALIIGQIAVTQTAQGKGIGLRLMSHAFENARHIPTGCYAIILDVIADGGKSALVGRIAWYERLGFQPLPVNRHRMFITMRQIRDSLNA